MGYAQTVCDGLNSLTQQNGPLLIPPPTHTITRKKMWGNQRPRVPSCPAALFLRFFECNRTVQNIIFSEIFVGSPSAGFLLAGYCCQYQGCRFLDFFGTKSTA